MKSLAAITVLGLASVASAGTITIARDNRGDDAYGGRYGGGEFEVISFTDGDVAPMGDGVALLGSVFSTFCLERNERMRAHETMDWEISDAARQGGIAGGNPDPLDPRTAYLFGKFWDGTLDGYDYALGEAHRGSSATSLQLAIWYFEDELGGRALHNVLAGDDLARSWIDDANANAGDDIGDVRVLNLTYSGRNGREYRQDVLIDTDHGGGVTSVPLPAAAWLGFGLVGLFGVREVRRRQTSGPIS